MSCKCILYTYVLSFLHFMALPKIKMLLFPEKVALSQIASQKAQPIIGFYIWKLKCKMHMLEKIVHIWFVKRGWKSNWTYENTKSMRSDYIPIIKNLKYCNSSVRSISFLVLLLQRWKGQSIHRFQAIGVTKMTECQEWCITIKYDTSHSSF